MAKNRKNLNGARGRLESRFAPTFVAKLALREKQIQQNYRPVIGIHKWFARRPGTLFRSLMLAEFGDGPLEEAFWSGHALNGTIADPFMGGGTSLYEGSRLGFSVVGCDINPMSHWLVARAFAPLDLRDFAAAAKYVAKIVEERTGSLFTTSCSGCKAQAPVKYFLWVKQAKCPHCETTNDLFPGHLLAEDERHPRNVLVCPSCGELNEYESVPRRGSTMPCGSCRVGVHVEGNVRRGRCSCRACSLDFAVPGPHPAKPTHRMWAIEYHCARCYHLAKGRQFKRPDLEDLAKHSEAAARLADAEDTLKLPDDEIPAGDETDRLHRWGYRRYRDMFSDRQLLVLGTLKEVIRSSVRGEVQNALLTVFSDILRYHNMLCRYDTYALKCQDIFSVHGFPVGLVQCENNVIGIPGIGSGGFNHFVEKYIRAKEYCQSPFEVRDENGRKIVVSTQGETIGAGEEGAHSKAVELYCDAAQFVKIPSGSLDGVFTDPPYFANVQYAELIDFCYVWLRPFVDTVAFASRTTRSAQEATGNATQGRGINEFTQALSAVFVAFAHGLKPGAPFVFTYHHNDPLAYAPLVVAILDARLSCTGVLPAAAEMSASLHISGTNSSVLDSVFVCRSAPVAQSSRSEVGAFPVLDAADFASSLRFDISRIAEAGVRIGVGDVRCLASGLVASMTVRDLHRMWQADSKVEYKLDLTREAIASKMRAVQFDDVVQRVFEHFGGRGARTQKSESSDASSL